MNDMHIKVKNWFMLIQFLCLFILLNACDTGIVYKPKDWSFVSGSYWTNRYGPAEFGIRALGGLIGSKVAGIEIIVQNHSGDQSIIVNAAILQTKNGRYPANIHIGPIGPGESEKGSLYWEFEEPIVNVLIEPVEILLNFQIGQEEKSVPIPMLRL